MANLTATFKLIDEMSAKLDSISQSGRNALTQWENAGASIDTAFDNAVGSTVQTAQSIDSTSDSIEQLTANANKAQKSVEDFGDESEAAGRKSEEFGNKTADAIQSVEELLVGAGIVKGLQEIGKAFVDCVEDAIEFESAITGVYKTVDGTEEQLAAISDEVKELSLNIPSNTTAIAAVAEAAGQLGIATDDVMAFTEVMINLGESTNLSADEAASSLAKFTNITGTAAENYENLGSNIVALGNNFATTEADIVAMSTRMASAGTLAGMTESDILALAASLSSVGIEADAGGSSMSTLISKMQLAVETGNEQLEQFASVAGYTADEFSQKWGQDAAGALYEFISGLNDTERNGASATAILDEMGITEIRLSNAIKALANNSDSLGEALEFSSAAWDENNALAKEANTRYSTLESKLAMTKNAATNLSTTVGDVFTPTVGGAADVTGDLLNDLTGFVKEHPTVVKGVAAVTTGVATFTGAIIAYTVATKAAKIAQAALNAVQLANPYYLVGAAIAAVTVGLVAFAVTMSDAEDETEKLTSASKKQAQEIEDLKAEYSDICDTYGETSYQAQELAWQIEDLEAAYEGSKQTMDEYRESFDTTMQSYYDMVERHEEAAEEVERESASIISLVERLDELTQQTDITAGEQEEILAIIKNLNEEVPGLSLSYDELTNKLSSSTEAIMALAEAEVATRKHDEYYEQLIEKMKLRADLEADLATATENKTAAQKELNKVQAEYNKWLKDNDIEEYGIYSDSLELEHRDLMQRIWEAQDRYDEFSADVDEATKAVEENEAAITETADKMAELSGVVEKGSDDMYTYGEACEAALGSVQTEVEELCTKYDEAYTAARESIDGQIGLFDKMVVKAETSVSDMQAAFESQLTYLSNYTENLKKAMDFGLDEDLISELSDGSEESAAYLDTIINKVEALGGTTDEAKKFVEDFNTQFQKVEAAKEEFSKTVADMETDFTEKMEEIEKQLETSIDNMKMEAEAAEAAKATMSGYISEIIAGGDSAVIAAANAAAKVKAALETGEVTPKDNTAGTADKTTDGTAKNAYALGTDNAAKGVAIVGENGPELVEFEGGETVYPADETSRILARAADAQFHTSATDFTNGGSDTETHGKEDSKTIRLEINGSGAIEVDKSMNEETVVGILYNNLKPVLMSIVKQEIYEEGDLAYDY